MTSDINNNPLVSNCFFVQYGL